MNPYAGLLIRKEITVCGVPGRWTTNLSDDDLREFYPLYCRDAILDEMQCGIFDKIFTLRYTAVAITVPFHDGACLWYAVQDHYSAIYRTNFEWELWNARKEELDELRDEESIEIQLFRTEDRHLADLASKAIREKDFEAAEASTIARAELRRKFQRPKTIIFFPTMLNEDAERVFASFPTINRGIAFLREYHPHSGSFHSFAQHFRFQSRLPLSQLYAQIEQIYDEAVRLFPNDARLYKNTCLFWRREKRLDLAIKYCREAADRGLRDDTKSSFSGRLKRLFSEYKSLSK